MRIGFYHERAGTRHAGGIAVYVRRMATTVARATDHEVVLFTREGDFPESLCGSRVEVTTLPPPVRSRRAARLVRRLSAGDRQKAEKLGAFVGALRTGHLGTADVVLTHEYLDDLLVSWASPVPTVYQYHGLRQVGLGAWTRERLSATRWHLANSRQTAREARQKLGQSVDGVVRPGVDVERFDPDVEPAFECERPVVLYVGRLVEPKGVFDLLAAFARVDADARLYLVGRGRTGAVRERARALDVGDAVTVAGTVPHEEMPGHYAAADVVCVPSHYESFGMVNLEAMACGVPLVATDACGLADLDEGALLVGPGDVPGLAAHLDALLADPERRDALGAAGREVARRHAWERQAEKLAAFCAGVVGAE